ncbi:MAG: tetratricopeptide repeat protein [Nitrospira sp.]|nr:tetratricopeptide repeat protein [Nitrospira sp.]
MDRSKVLQQAQLLASKGQITEAIAEWKKLAAEAPNDGSIPNSIGDLYLKRNAVSEASAAFFQAAKLFKAEGATVKAIATYKKVLKCDPTKYEVYRHLGDLNGERGLISSAAQDYLMLAKQLIKEGKPKDALVLYQKIVSLDPSNLSAQQRIAELCLQDNRPDEASEVYLQLGRERSMQGRHEEAKDAYLAVLRIDPKNHEAAQFVEGVKKGGTISIKAVKAGTPASEKTTSSPPLGPLDEAIRRMEEKQYAGAEAILNQILSREPGNPQVCQLLARLHLQRGDFQLALGEYRFLAGEALRAQDLPLAETLIKEFLSAQPDSVPLLELNGELCERQQNRAAAAQQYARAVELLLVHPEPGMEDLHEELFEKVRALSPDPEFVDRLAAKIHGESVAPAESSTQGAVSSDVSTFSIEGAEPDDFRPVRAHLQSEQELSFSLEGAEPDATSMCAIYPTATDTASVQMNVEVHGEGTQEAEMGQPEVVQVTVGKDIDDGQQPIPVEPAAAATPVPDYEAHFTLGVAYKNMALYSEARAEFEIARTADTFCLDSHLMMALCDKEEGHVLQAIRGLEAVLSDSRAQGANGQALRYELGLLYEAAEEWMKATVTFQSIPSFHDVPTRLAAIKGRSQSATASLRLAS